jgi:hypothetical protein
VARSKRAGARSRLGHAPRGCTPRSRAPLREAAPRGRAPRSRAPRGRPPRHLRCVSPHTPLSAASDKAVVNPSRFDNRVVSRRPTTTSRVHSLADKESYLSKRLVLAIALSPPRRTLCAHGERSHSVGPRPRPRKAPSSIPPPPGRAHGISARDHADGRGTRERTTLLRRAGHAPRSALARAARH